MPLPPVAETGSFVFDPREARTRVIQQRGGALKTSVSRALDYLIVGGSGSHEWKHGSFGTKIEKAVELKRAGSPLRIVHEDRWASCL